MSSNLLTKYYAGGMDNENPKIIKIGGTVWAVGEKIKSYIRNSLIDWGTFLQIYDNEMTDEDLFNQIIKMLKLNVNGNIDDVMLPIIKKIYKLPLEQHGKNMINQFTMHEPLTAALYNLFTIFKNHYEYLVLRYVNLRNQYIAEHKLSSKINNLDELMDIWEHVNNDYNINSSSIVLLFAGKTPSDLNIPKISWKVPNIKETNDLHKKMNKFSYPGYCPKVPHERINALMDFPIQSLVASIKKLNPKEKLPDYSVIYKQIQKILSTIPTVPKLKDSIKKKIHTYMEKNKPPKKILNQAKKISQITSKAEKRLVEKNMQEARKQLLIWYTTEILKIRKQLLSYGRSWEKYYAEKACIIDELNKKLAYYLDKYSNYI